MNVLLGSNLINNCDSALVVNGEEVFRFREGQSNDQLLCDFDLTNQGGQRIAKVAKNQVVHVAAGYTYQSTGNRAEIHDGNGTVVASVERLDANTLKLNGTFHVKGHTVVITDQALQSAGVTMSGNVISGFGKAISLEPGSFAIGSR